ncbi:hypothetical protein BCR34DRAFT_587611 [Clohesyomyces aquaticus]|uniref:Uncharacterized protein n=1 Tax=Clohesyomyces aquaticus TaxID=1231657 RepID=A0A1Y1ZNX4_9PLEO|nr:hypothetical protein BCR34DRAFT_587611 [Clohesyomyces aquaticus]
MAFLYETVLVFEDTWLEYLEDLGRYRMAIEDEEPDVTKIPNGDRRRGFHTTALSTALFLCVECGRIISGVVGWRSPLMPHAPQQLYYYARSLIYIRDSRYRTAKLLIRRRPLDDYIITWLYLPRLNRIWGLSSARSFSLAVKYPFQTRQNTPRALVGGVINSS